MGMVRRVIVPASRSRSSSSRLLLVYTLLLVLCLRFQQAGAHGGIDDDHDDASPAPPVGYDHHADQLKERSSGGLIAVKVWCLVILLVLTFLGGVSPYFFRWNESFLVLGTQFAGGVFLGTSLMHFLAGSAETFRALTRNRYPLSYMLTCVGYLATMLADCVIVAVAERASTSSSCRRNNKQNQQQSRRVVNEEEERKEEEEVDAEQQQQQQQHQHGPMIMLQVTTNNKSSSSLGDAVLLIVALCFHSVFEGIAIGVSPTKRDAWRNLWTIGLHKVFAAVAMGVALLRFIPKRPLVMSVAYSLAFAVSSPVGVGIGMAVIDATPRARGWVYAVSMGFATGIFVYVAINHLMAKGYRPQEPCRVDRPLFRFLAVGLGVAVMAVAMIWD